MAYLTPPKRSTSRSHRHHLIGADLERCIYCESLNIIKKGKRYKKLEIIQLWCCRACDRVFTPQRAKGKTYPLKVILESLMLYYRGETRQRTATRIKERFGIAVPPRTLSQWLAEYRTLTTYERLREQGRARFAPHSLIRSVRLHHKQVYTFRIHQGKLDRILNNREHRQFSPIADYLTEMAEDCPHRLFQATINTNNRASQGKAAFNLDSVEIKAKRNHACRIAELSLHQCACPSL